MRTLLACLSLLGCARPQPAGAFHGDRSVFVARRGSWTVRAEPSGRWSFTPGAGIAPLIVETLGEEAQLAVASDGSLGLTRGRVTERLRAGVSGVEQSWRFSEVPEQLRLRVRVDGQKLRRDGADGLHFVDEKSGGGTRYGTATLIDAQGRRLAIAPRFEAGAIVLEAPRAWLAAAVAPLLLDPILSPELPIDAPVAALSSDATLPVVAFDGAGYLVAWNDTRPSPSPGIYAAHAGSDGFFVSAHGTLAAVAFDGADSLLVSTASDGVWGARVSPSGAVLDAFAIASFAATTARVAFDGSNRLVAWISGGAVLCARVAPGGALLDATPITVENTATPSDLALAWDGSHYWVMWAAGAVWGVRVAVDGTVGAPVQLTPAGVVHGPAAVCSGGMCMLSWQEGNWTTNLEVCSDTIGCCYDPIDVKTLRFSAADGSPLDAAPLVLQYVYAGTTALASDGTDALVLWDQQMTVSCDWGPNVIQGARVRWSDGTLEDPTPFSVGSFSGTQHHPALTFGGGRFFAAWDDQRVTTQVYATPLDPSPSPSLISGYRGQSNYEGSPAIAWNGSQYFAVWLDTRNGGYDLYGARLGPDGAALDAPARAISLGGDPKSYLSVASNGSDFLVVWREQLSVRGVRVSAAGLPLDAAPLALSGAYGSDTPVNLALASNGSSYLVGWMLIPYGAGYLDTAAIGRLVQADGTLGPEQSLIHGLGINLGGIASDGKNYFAVAGQEAAWIDPAAGVEGAILDGTGAQLGFFQVAGTAMGEGPNAAFDGKSFLLTWRAAGAVSAIRVAPDGTLLDPSPSPITGAVERPSYPRTSFDGKNFVVVWAAYGGQTGGTRVASDGTVLDPEGLALPIPAESYPPPQLASDGSGRSALVYADSGRAVLRFLDDSDQALATGSQCVSNADCQNHHCSDGFCCDSACGDPCVACNLPGLEGSCQVVATAVIGGRPICTGAHGAPCGGYCDGVSSGCSYPDTSVVCRAASCQSGSALAAANCDGKGSCPFNSSACAPYACSGNGCGVTCAGDSGCDDSSYCDGGACALKKDLGAPCAGHSQCRWGECYDGYCCNNTCDQLCEACNLPGQEGNCVAVQGPPAPGHGSCGGSGPCAPVCDGSSYTQCGESHALLSTSCFFGQVTGMQCQGGQAVAVFVQSCLFGCSGDGCAPTPSAPSPSPSTAPTPPPSNSPSTSPTPSSQPSPSSEPSPSSQPSPAPSSAPYQSPPPSNPSHGLHSVETRATGCGCEVGARQPPLSGALLLALLALLRRRVFSARDASASSACAVRPDARRRGRAAPANRRW